MEKVLEIEKKLDSFKEKLEKLAESKKWNPLIQAIMVDSAYEHMRYIKVICYAAEIEFMDYFSIFEANMMELFKSSKYTGDVEQNNFDSFRFVIKDTPSQVNSRLQEEFMRDYC